MSNRGGIVEVSARKMHPASIGHGLTKTQFIMVTAIYGKKWILLPLIQTQFLEVEDAVRINFFSTYHIPNKIITFTCHIICSI